MLAGALFTHLRDSVPFKGTKVKDISFSVFNFDNILRGRVGIVFFLYTVIENSEQLKVQFRNERTPYLNGLKLSRSRG